MYWPRSVLFQTLSLLLLASLLRPVPAWGQEQAEAPAPVQSSEDAARRKLDAAIRAYEHGGYLSAAEQLNAILYPLKLSNKQDIVLAKAWLGMSLYILGRRLEAEQEFRGVFRLQPGWKPDPLKVPPELVAFIERLRPVPERSTVLPGLGEELKVGGLPAQLPPGIVSRSASRPVWRAFLPFGVEQLLRHERGVGLASAISQGIFLSLNLGTYFYLKTAAVDPPASTSGYERLVAAKAVNLTSFGLFTTVYVLSVGEALLSDAPSDAGAAAPRSPQLLLSLTPQGQGWIGLHGTF